MSTSAVMKLKKREEDFFQGFVSFAKGYLFTKKCLFNRILQTKNRILEVWGRAMKLEESKRFDNLQLRLRFFFAVSNDRRGESTINLSFSQKMNL